MARISNGLTPSVADEVGDAVGEHPGLARPGAGHDQQRALGVGDRVGLHRVEPLEQVADGIVDGPSAPHAGRRGPPAGAPGAPSGPASASAVSERGSVGPGIARPIVGPGCDTGAGCRIRLSAGGSPVRACVPRGRRRVSAASTGRQAARTPRRKCGQPSNVGLGQSTACDNRSRIARVARRVRRARPPCSRAASAGPLVRGVEQLADLPHREPDLAAATISPSRSTTSGW